MNAPTENATIYDIDAVPSDEPSDGPGTPESENSDEPEGAAQAALDINFLALDGQPIAKMGVAIRWKEGELIARTDAGGCLPPVQAPAGTELTISVQRFDGSYKDIGICLMPASEGTLTAVSPNIVLETKTEKHEGAPGIAEERIPKPQEGDLGDLKPAGDPTEASAPKEAETPSPESSVPKTPAPTPHPSETVATDKTGQRPPHSSTTQRPRNKPKAPAGKPEAKAKHQADKPPQHISGREAQKTKLEKGRDENGNPLAVITQKTLDWWNSWRMPTFDLWGTPSSGGKAAPSGPKGSVPGNAAGTTPATPVAFSADMVKKVETLLEFAKEQTEYDYKASKEGTAKVLASMGNGMFKHKSGEKETHESRGLCYTYVKVALARCKIVDGMLVGESASGAGRSLIAKGFKDVTADVPDARWAAAGDVIVYEWSEPTWEGRKRKKKKPDLPNHGHIDIRDYEFYISDFIPAPPRYLGHPTWFRERPKDKSGNFPPEGQYYPEYVNIRIYRKVFDPLPTQRIRAFLRCIREFECQAEHDESKRYHMLNTPLPGGEKRFTSYATHPWEGKPKPAKGSDAAGAYQIRLRTWKEIFDKGLIEPKKERFSPAIQDRIAVMKLEDRGVLHMIRAGRIKEALEYRTEKGVLSLVGEWSSLPGGKENAGRLTADKKPMDMAYLLSLFDKYLDEERKKG
jgi:muramidase (phage lysozyme)